MSLDTQEQITRAIVAVVQLPSVSDVELNVSINELRELAKTLGYEVVATFVQKRSSFDPGAYLGVGKRQEMRRFVESLPDLEADEVAELPEPTVMRKAAKSGAARAKEAAQSEADPDTRRADMVLVDHEISPSQARNLEIEVGCEVMDRTMVILEIFHRHASSRAARAQVEIARLGYLAPRRGAWRW
jgi:GTPase